MGSGISKVSISLICTENIRILKNTWNIKNKYHMISNTESNDLQESKISLDKEPDITVPPIRFIDFENIKKCKSIPRYPEMKEFTINLDKILNHRDKSILIFVSHCWLRGYPGAVGYDKRPHPDNQENSKLKLIISGIEKLLKNLASTMEYCYLWIDFSCMDQDSNPAGELKQLDKIVKSCDCLFTPIYDPDWNTWEFPNGMINNIYNDYQAKLWNNGDHAYINRGWCRVEMFYAANIPLLANNNDRINKLVSGLKLHLQNGIRPHLLYGDKEYYQNQPPKILPPIQNSYYHSLNPTAGMLSNDSDMVHIKQLIKVLEPYIQYQQETYDGECINGNMNGKGIFKYMNGDIYEGQLKNGMLHGNGIYKYSNGHRYIGEFKHNIRDGKGIYFYSSGDIYEGDWSHDTKHGKGYLTYASGDTYEGDYVHGKKHGKGIYRYASGNVYEGDFRDDQI